MSVIDQAVRAPTLRWAGRSAAAWLIVPLALVVLVGCRASTSSPLPEDIPLDVVRVGGGTCLVGSREGRSHEQVRAVAVKGFWMSSREVSVAEYVASLQGGPGHPPEHHPQFLLRAGRYVPRPGRQDQPVSHVDYDEARSYCSWLARQSSRVVRLPTEDEWEIAARGGIRGARYPWGWGAPIGRAHFHAAALARRASYPANAFGLFDMAGGVYEWCLARDEAHAESRAFARGGSWAERDPRYLMVHTRVSFPRDYRDLDVGFRVLVE